MEANNTGIIHGYIRPRYIKLVMTPAVFGRLMAPPISPFRGPFLFVVHDGVLLIFVLGCVEQPRSPSCGAWDTMVEESL